MIKMKMAECDMHLIFDGDVLYMDVTGFSLRALHCRSVNFEL